MVTIETYKSVNGLDFGKTASNAKQMLGKPCRESISRSGNLELVYDDITYIFYDDRRRFCEGIVHRDANLSINGISCGWSLGELARLCIEDGTPLESYGSVLLLNLGLVLTGVEEDAESDRTIGAFQRGTWDRYLNEFKPFQIPRDGEWSSP